MGKERTIHFAWMPLCDALYRNLVTTEDLATPLPNTMQKLKKEVGVVIDEMRQEDPTWGGNYPKYVRRTSIYSLQVVDAMTKRLMMPTPQSYRLRHLGISQEILQKTKMALAEEDIEKRKRKIRRRQFSPYLFG